jgi:DNA-binding protein HU-beta
MNKSDLIKDVADLSGLTQTEARNAIDNLVKVIIKKVGGGQSVNLRGFGTFRAVQRGARKAQHPRTRKVINVSAKKVPVFRASPEWKEMLRKKR